MSRFDDLQTEILYLIWENAYKPGSSLAFHIGALPNILPPDKIFGATQAALSALNGKQLLGSNSSEEYWISEQGINFIERLLEDPSSTVSAISRRANREAVEADNGSIPASDRFVTLDHNSDPYREAIVALDAAVTAFQEDHRLENDWGAEKGVLLQSLEAGQRLLKETSVRTRTVVSTVIDPLRIIADRYREAIAAGLITATVDQVLPSVERAISALLTLIGIS